MPALSLHDRFEIALTNRGCKMNSRQYSKYTVLHAADYKERGPTWFFIGAAGALRVNRTGRSEHTPVSDVFKAQLLADPATPTHTRYGKHYRE